LTNTTSNASSILRPEQVADLLVKPVLALSVAARPEIATVVQTGSKTFRIPMVNADPQAAWVAEGAEIAVSDAVLAELDVTPSKVAGLTLITNELAADSSPEAAQVVGDGLARDIARRLDEAFFGALASPAPAGLESLPTTTGNAQIVAAGTSFADLDAFAEAQALAENVGATVTAFVAHPTDALALAQLKGGTALATPLLSQDPTQPSRRQIFGTPLLVSPAVTPGHVWALDGSRNFVVLRQDATVDIDPSPFFTSDRTAVRGIMRVGIGWPHPAAVVRITLG
jgi:HK97 family phage major capsid protein